MGVGGWGLGIRYTLYVIRYWGGENGIDWNDGMMESWNITKLE